MATKYSLLDSNGVKQRQLRLDSNNRVEVYDVVNGIVTKNLELSRVSSKTAAYTATLADETLLCDASGGAFTVTLPTASGNTGKEYVIKKTDTSSNAVTVDGNGSETIDGVTTVLLNSTNEALHIMSDGSNWVTVSPTKVHGVVSVTTTYTAKPEDEVILCDATSAAFTVTLYTAVGNIGRVVTIIKTEAGANAVTVDGNGSETIDGATTYTLAGSALHAVTIVSDGANWHIISSK